MNFLPAMSAKAKKAKGQQIRAWHLHRRSGGGPLRHRQGNQRPGQRLDQLLWGLLSSELYSLTLSIDQHLVRWATQKFKRLRNKPTKAGAGWLLSDSTSPPLRPLVLASTHQRPTCGGG